MLIKNITAKLKNNKNVLENILWLFFDKALRMGMGIVVGVWIARYLGPTDFGVLNYALAIVAIFAAIATLGMESILIKEFVSEKYLKRDLLGTSFILRFSSSLGCSILILLFAYLFEIGDKEVFAVVSIIGFTLLFQSFDVIDWYYQAKLISRKTVIAKNTGFVLSSVLKVWLILHNYSLVYFALATLLEFILGAIFILFTLKGQAINISTWRFKSSLAIKIFKQSWPLVFAALSVVLYMRIDQVMIKYLLNANAVGQYSAAVRLTEIWYFLPTIIVSSSMPALIQAKTDKRSFENKIKKLYSLLIYSGLAISLVISFSGDFLISFLFGTEYKDAATVLQVHVWSCIFVFIGVASSQYLVIENQTKASLYRTVLGLISNILFNLVLIPMFGILGAAIATLISYFVSSVLSNYFFKGTRGINKMYIAALNFTKFL